MKHMKRAQIALIAAIMVMALCTTLKAGAQLRYGFRFSGEFASASLKGADGYAVDNKSGFSGGLALEYQMPSNGFAVDIAALYTRYNTRLKAPEGRLSSFGRNFIEVPVHFKYKFWLKPVHELAAPFIYAGPSFLFRLDHDGSIPLATDRVQPGWDGGIGVDIVNFIQISGGYRFGLGNAVNSWALQQEPVLRTNGWNVAAAILFDF